VKLQRSLFPAATVLPAKTFGFIATEGDFLKTIERDYKQATQKTENLTTMCLLSKSEPTAIQQGRSSKWFFVFDHNELLSGKLPGHARVMLFLQGIAGSVG
jgi:hypothetical protein